MSRPAPARSRCAPRPSVEPLEPRAVPAVFNVNSLTDILSPPAGTVTLRSAIQAANATPGPNTINLTMAGTYKITTLGVATDNSAGELAIAGSGDLTIANISGGTVTISGGGLNRVFDINPSAATKATTVTLRGLTITDGAANFGGGIRVQGGTSLSLDHAIVRGNVSAVDGGGIVVLSGATGTLTLTASQISGNRAIGYGGGIADASSGLLAIGPQSIISGNASQYDGGGIDLQGAPLSATGVVMSGNSSTAGHGGAVHNRAAGQASFSGCLVENNVAYGSGGGYGDTVGLAALSVTNSFFLNNAAGAEGGGIYMQGTGSTISGSCINGNFAALGGGGIELRSSSNATAKLTDSVVSGNSSQEGGGVETGTVALTASGCTFADNRATDGGGLRFYSGTGMITGSLFRDDTATAEGGAIQYIGGTLTIGASRLTGNAAAYGGAVDDLGGGLSVATSTLDNNRSIYRGGALDFEPGTNTSASLTDCTIAFNTTAGDGGGIAVFSTAYPTLNLTADTIDGNAATFAGGGLSMTFSQVTEANTIIAGNTAAGLPNDLDNNQGGQFTDAGGNLLGTTAGAGGTLSPNILIANPKLGPLLDNGGRQAGAPSDGQIIPTQALLPGSPAIGKAVTGTGIPTSDERNFPRPSKPSIGAYEPQYASNASANQVFVENLFEVLLNRVADPGSLASAVNYLNGGGAGVTLVQILQGSTEFRDIEATQAFRRYLDRAPSQAEQGNVANYLASATPEQLAAFLVEQPEFFNDYGNSTDVFVEALYGDILDSTASSIERAGWDQLITNNGTRAGVAGIFLGLPTYLDLLLDADYPAYVGRPPSRAERANLVKMWPGFNSLEIQALLLGYGEAFARRT